MNIYDAAQIAAKLCRRDGLVWSRLDRQTRDRYLDLAEETNKEGIRAQLHARVYEPPSEDG